MRATRRPLSSKSIPPLGNKTEGKNENNVDTVEQTVVGKFVGTAIVGKSEAENACHSGLVDPTINMKEAMNDINSMFREPLEDVPMARKSRRKQSKEDNGLDVFIDENLDNGVKPSASSSQQHGTKASQSHPEPLQIFIDDGRSETSDMNDVQNLSEDFTSSNSQLNAFVFPRPQDPPENSGNLKFREDTVVRRFVGSTILDEPKVENVCHHGLVEPTINTKEAMDDINDMFGKPMDFVRRKRSKKQEKVPESTGPKELGGFSILVDDDTEQGPPPQKLARKPTESDLFEPTMLTKEAMDDINKMFNMPMNF